jgi:lysophospholipase L1-like esterase
VLRRSFCATIFTGLSLFGVGFLIAADSSPSERWERTIHAFETADKESPPPPGAVLFIGSSSVRLWKSLPKDLPQYNVINRGFGGSRIADSTYFADRIVFPYKPSAIILHSGSNDLAAGKSPQQVFADFKAFVEKVRSALPETPIAFMSINPTPARWAQADKQKETNRLIKDYIASNPGRGLTFIDQWDVLLGPDGLPRPDLHIRDRLHPNAAGYKIRTELVGKYLASLNLPTRKQ